MDARDATDPDDQGPPPRDPGETPLERDDRDRSLAHRLDRLAPSRRAVWPKDDRRSSERIEPPPDQHAGPPANG